MQYNSSIFDYLNRLPDYVKKILIEYSKKTLSSNRFFIYREYIKNHETTKKVVFDKNRWEQRPHLFCYDYYSSDEQYLYPVILTINNIKSIYEFLPERFEDRLILAPSNVVIKEILSKGSQLC